MPELNLRAAMGLQGRLKLAQLFAMPERELAELARRLEAKPIFARLRAAGAVRLAPFPKAYFTARNFAGWGLRASSAGLPELVDGNCDLALLMSRIGAERFEAVFLKDQGASDEERARLCGITAAQARSLREFLDRAYIQEEFSPPAAAPSAAKVFSPVAGIGLEAGKAVISFFNREIWKGRYQVDEERLAAHLAGLSPAEAERAQSLVRRLQFLDQRKTTLYRAIEALVEAQADYLSSKDPAQRQALTQRSLAAALGVDASVINRLVSNKSVQLPWGLEAPMKALLPSAKAVSLDKLDALARARPELSDEGLRQELARSHQIFLSRRSVTQYRKELALARGGRRRRA